MKYLDDKELKDLLQSRKLDMTDQTDYNYLWADVQRQIAPGIAEKIGSLLYKVGVVVLIAPFLLIQDHKSQATLTTLGTATVESNQLGQRVAAERSTTSIEQEVNDPSQFSEPVVNHPKSDEPVAVETDTREPANARAQTHTVVEGPAEGVIASDEPSRTVTALHQVVPFTIHASPADTFGEPTLLPIKDKEQRMEVFDFVAAVPYLTYHTLFPSRLDENLIEPQQGSKVGFLERTGIQFARMRTRPLRKRFSLNYGATLDVYSSRLPFLIANNLSPVRELENKSVDLGLSVGLQRQVHVLHSGMAGIELGVRNRLLSWGDGDALQYDALNTTYRIYYLVDLNSWMVGPSYASFIRHTRLPGVGTVRPSMFGINIRKKLIRKVDK